VLLVDDDGDTLEMLEHALAPLGAEVRAAGRADDALAAMAGWIPHLIISDIGMPDQDGYTFIRHVRALGPLAGGDTPAIALTAHRDPQHEARAFAAGYQAYLSKPIDPDELARAAARLLQSGPRSPRSRPRHDREVFASGPPPAAGADPAEKVA
jgi:CheY-like chemotaxis protein